MNMLISPEGRIATADRTQEEGGRADAFHTLQTLVLPTPDRADRTMLYARWAHGAASNADERGFRLPDGVPVDFCTFFNAFSAGKWADATGLGSVVLELSGTGRADLVVRAYSATGAARPVVERSIDLSPRGCRIALPPLDSLDCALLAFSLAGAADGAVLTGGRWITEEPPARSVTVTVVITTFAREAAAAAAIERFRSEVLPAFGGGLELVVVDNGRSLPASSERGITVIPNDNLGGAGGFARGLIEAIDRGRATHVLFMDDDAACETESILRAATLASRLENERASVAGAMLLEERPWIQHEKGARIGLGREERRLWHTLGAGADLSDPSQVCGADGPDGANYGAFWFYLFPLAAVRSLPFPFFVRGDDIDFSLSNDFEVVTLNGVATWAPAFVTKQSAATEYLSWRATLALFLTHASRRMALRALRKCRKTALRSGFRFDYATMHAIAAAMDDVSAGPFRFMDEPGPLGRLAEIRALSRTAPKQDFAVAEIRPMPPAKRSLSARIFVLLTVGGYLLPRSRRDPFIRHARDAWGIHPVQTVRADRLLFGEGAETRLHRRDRAAMLAGTRRVLASYLRLRFSFARIRDDWRTHRSWPRSQGYWRARLGLGGGSE